MGTVGYCARYAASNHVTISFWIDSFMGLVNLQGFQVCGVLGIDVVGKPSGGAVEGSGQGFAWLVDGPQLDLPVLDQASIRTLAVIDAVGNVDGVAKAEAAVAAKIVLD